MVWEALEYAAGNLRAAGKQCLLNGFDRDDERQSRERIAFSHAEGQISTLGTLSGSILLLMVLLFPFLSLFPHPSLLFGVLCMVCLFFGIRDACKIRKFDRLDAIILLLAFFMLLNDCFSVSGFDGNGLLRAAYLLSGWLICRRLFAVKTWRTRIVICFLLSGSVCSLFGILQYFSGKSEMRWLENARFDLLGGRVISTFQNPNFLAVYLLVLLGISMGFLFQNPKKNVLGWIALILTAGCLILTWTRGAWLGAIAAGCFFLLFYSRFSLALLFVSPLFLVSVIPLLPKGIVTRFSSIGNFAETSARYRLETWKGVLRLLRTYPWGIGSGEQAFHLVFPAFAVSGTESVMHAHSIYLQILTEYGLAGFFAFFLFVGLLSCHFLRTFTKVRSPKSRSLFLGLASALVGLLVMGLFDHLWYQPTLLFLPAMLAGGISAFDTSVGEKEYET